jgi:ubiquitin-like domain-containing CTD phosphatase 1
MAALASADSELPCKWGKERFSVPFTPAATTVGELRARIASRTTIPVAGIKLLNLKKRKHVASLHDDLVLDRDCKLPKLLKIMGTAQTEIDGMFEGMRAIADVFDDLDATTVTGNALEGTQKTMDKLIKAIAATPVESEMMNAPRPGKKLIVLDLDHTILDFKGVPQQQSEANAEAEAAAAGSAGIGAAGAAAAANVSLAHVKRPGAHAFLEEIYKSYDIVIWSQTHWRWLEIKLVELGFLDPHRPYKFLFILDKTCMFRVQQRDRHGKIKKKSCKPLQLIWTKFPQFNKKNTLHLDDLTTNFCLNPRNGLKCSAYYRTKKGAKKDCELLLWAKYLNILAKDDDVTTRDHTEWMVTLQQNPGLSVRAADDIGNAGGGSSSSSSSGGAGTAAAPEETDVEAEMLAAAIAASLAGNG